MIAGYQISRCPVRLTRSIDRAYLQFYGEWKKGVLPNAGGSLDQPMKFLQIMTLIDNVLIRLQKEENNG